MKDNTSYGERSLAYAEELTNASFGRGSATEAEAQAAETVRGWLTELGIAQVNTQPFQGLRSIWLLIALAFGIALAGHAAYWMLMVPLGKVFGALIASLIFGLAGYVLYRKFTFQSHPFEGVLPHGPSQNVVAQIPPTGEVKQRVVLIGHLDTHRAVFWYSHDILVTLYNILSSVSVYGVVASPLLYLLAAITKLDLLTYIALFLGFVHFLTWFSGVTADLGPYSPGANDNASAVGTVLSLTEHLQTQPLENTEVWLAFTGCEETGCGGMIAFLDQYGDELQDAFFLNFELVGIGERLVYLKDEGVARKRSIDPAVERIVQETGARFEIEPVEGSGRGMFTEMGTVWERGMKGVCLVALRKGSPLLPEWHRLTDLPERLEVGTLDKVHKMAWVLLQRTDVEGWK